MTKTKMLVSILIVMFVVTAITVVTQMSKACQCGADSKVISMNMGDSNNMNGTGMKGMKTGNDGKLQRGYAICPVCHMKVKITKNTPFVVYGDRKYYFHTDEEKQEFLKDPQKYINSMKSRPVNKPPLSNENKGM